VHAAILVTLMMEALHSSETSVLTRVTWCDILEDYIHHSLHRENLKSYEMLILSRIISQALLMALSSSPSSEQKAFSIKASLITFIIFTAKKCEYFSVLFKAAL
jgi:hypothetical protein